MKRILFACLLMITTVGYSQTTYYWVGGTAATSFTSNANWNTVLNGSGSTRAATAATDILIFDGSNIGGSIPVTGTVNVSTFGKAQYQWNPQLKSGSADPDGPILKSTVTAGKGTAYTLPAASVTVLRGSIAKAQ